MNFVLRRLRIVVGFVGKSCVVLVAVGRMHHVARIGSMGAADIVDFLAQTALEVRIASSGSTGLAQVRV